MLDLSVAVVAPPISWGGGWSSCAGVPSGEVLVPALAPY